VLRIPPDVETRKKKKTLPVGGKVYKGIATVIIQHSFPIIE
jgi:hypothetical protein